MYPCSSCHRHLRDADRTCPFCGTEQQLTSSVRDPVALFVASVALLGTIACSKDPAPADAGETTSETTTATTSTETSGSMTETETETGSMTSNTTNTSGSFYAGPDVDLPPFTDCYPWQQDCPDGEKCVPYSEFGGDWTDNKCVLVTGDGGPGDTCTWGGVVEANDTCDQYSHCWTGGQGMDGTCQPFCTGTPDNPMCPDGMFCIAGIEGVVNLCLDTCDPLAQACDDGTACYWEGEAFICIVTTQDLATGEPCTFINECAGGNVCLDAANFPSCMGLSCCAAYCDTGDMNACPDPDLECVPFFQQGEAPDGLEHVGVCILP